MKNILLKICFALVFAFVVFFGGNALVHSTQEDTFCVVCHEWMDPFVDTYAHSSHGGANKNGFKAKCVECHLPHDNHVKYIFQKALNGFNEVTHMAFNDAKDAKWQENRKNRSKFVFDTGCLSCHKTILDINSTNQNIKDMHNLYVKFKNDPKEKLDCVTCHKNVGHKELGKTLYELKHPPVGAW
ncbi:NapC/NirT cytochrome c family protein [Campylobacter pinnipediorum subsp. caledonicus]|uniref:Cytochrome c-type protein n=1 Tax=Campylobacter pinnipediorum subsp. caledonicus TaxID=1874362 RepID=A0A1S6U7X4_9BACT|nr:NapC/NirT family cytochrome c [Campylobacter pinnipediorum]AQW81437.1 NapC/NirT cytochrome c family protein [Campylobacter pinnipediorum subsp. pinnipediorum]AQW84633.1 NapC/NirT cytochrome c family protein [Campylobacter pinnipediorum subsp. pinnipediorum]AQW86239.1 NapC/NirT cytochrome c family protein [Campylobacter pinnipediorum subsp. caledonicus]AQW87846.1 NapC/NirT cytochrome c family protein [Campylobacter pinnipediorum subsp. caledonicus]OPA71996.1 cytochrome C [Campylobacter pinni